MAELSSFSNPLVGLGFSEVGTKLLLLLLLLLVRDVQRSTYALGRHGGSLYSRIDHSALLIVCYPSG